LAAWSASQTFDRQANNNRLQCGAARNRGGKTDWVLVGSQALPQSMGKRPLQFFGGTAPPKATFNADVFDFHQWRIDVWVRACSAKV
jgi:hypothetical protein